MKNQSGLCCIIPHILKMKVTDMACTREIKKLGVYTSLISEKEKKINTINNPVDNFKLSKQYLLICFRMITS